MAGIVPVMKGFLYRPAKSHDYRVWGFIVDEKNGGFLLRTAHPRVRDRRLQGEECVDQIALEMEEFESAGQSKGAQTRSSRLLKAAVRDRSIPRTRIRVF